MAWPQSASYGGSGSGGSSLIQPAPVTVPSCRTSRHDGRMTTRAPAGLGPSGRALWRGILADYGLAPHERVILMQCCRVADRLDAIEAELGSADLVVTGSTGQPKSHPLLAEWRAQARVLESLSRALSIPPPGGQGGPPPAPPPRRPAPPPRGR